MYGNNYITYRHYKRDNCLCNEPVNLHYGVKLIRDDKFLALPETPEKHILKIYSFDYSQYFSVNDDGRGLERGKLCYAIAYSKREKETENGIFRFSTEEQKMLFNDYSHWLHDVPGILLFNHDFFDANVDELMKLAKILDIKPEE